MFVGREISRFGTRQVNRLRAGMKEGYWATSPTLRLTAAGVTDPKRCINDIIEVHSRNIFAKR
jgi:hypothetical protein